VKNVNDAESKGIIGRRLGSIIRKPIDEDIEKVTDYLAKRKLQPLTDHAAAKERAQSDYKTAIRTIGRDGLTLHKELKEEADLWEHERSEWEKSAPPRGTAPHYRKASYDGTRPSTFELMGNLGKCAAKGCLSDCRPWKKLYIDVKTGPKTGLTTRIKKSESVKNET